MFHIIKQYYKVSLNIIATKLSFAGVVCTPVLHMRAFDGIVQGVKSNEIRETINYKYYCSVFIGWELVRLRQRRFKLRNCRLLHRGRYNDVIHLFKANKLMIAAFKIYQRVL